MPGFIDVTGWTSEEVRRLGHMDDDYETPQPRRNRRQSMPVTKYTPDVVWGAAAYATRINGGYFKTPTYDETGTKIIKPVNRDIMKIALADQTAITEADQQMGRDAREFIAQQLTLKTLKGKLSDFDRGMVDVVGMTEFTSNDRYKIAIVASQIRAYEQAQKDIKVQDRVDRSKGYLADVGAKVQANVEVTKVIYSQNYNVFFVSGITDTNQAVFFSYREKIAVGSQIQVKGTVKAHRPDATQLSRVRVGA